LAACSIRRTARTHVRLSLRLVLALSHRVGHHQHPPLGGPCLNGQWGHASCAGAQQAAARNKAEVLAGETFRSRQQSSWRRGTSPGSSRRKT
jgi:hypothetical protein